MNPEPTRQKKKCSITKDTHTQIYACECVCVNLKYVFYSKYVLGQVQLNNSSVFNVVLMSMCL